MLVLDSLQLLVLRDFQTEETLLDGPDPCAVLLVLLLHISVLMLQV